MSLIENLEWRHATKAYDPTKKVSETDLNKILEAIRLAPTSSGLQQFRVVVVEDQETKNKLVNGALNPECVTDCSHILVFAAWDNYTDEKIDKVYDLTTDERDLPRGRFDSYTSQLKESLSQLTNEQHFEHAAKQSYIGLGLALAQAAELRIDSTPAEGFNSKVFDEVLDLPAKGLKSTVIMYLGYSDTSKDWLSTMKKVRVPMDEFVIRVK
ncbi:Nitroreductase [Algoriella xinjiangensis]|uniref:Nitroreductase n=1 Tax=Algoriella xinjiangensis TaxID=684065 RepID=A0A1I4S428_9FLAO|nr:MULTISPECIES: nitroreductase family protein [Algoriella]MBO6211567.1 nitroreductase family protein [Algoriella sp.]SFM59151.1 Nitroreductase [Algoriella xinjiangensis]VDH15886.1 Major NAD(P)H-flavin oxidoreductase [Algoriella xinjiangensis]